ncbi:UbiD family decarboxylase [uncultured Lamprocystis sp.]|jgi:4-hydroxy-3-polyprenylbenzoate decarboxylase|uniref:UbiD family decarboxylase n=3 Tax=uncultured Lamprocystis sp. TaxID=543132 RepID=UPI0025FBBE02|nr:UbiD family decarboxylase [uncultured Lamprocystis sp.]
MTQQTLSDFVATLEKIGQLVRISDERHVNDLPAIMEAHPDTAVLVEKIKDCELQFLANAYSNRTQYASALGCKPSDLAQEIARRGSRTHEPVVVATAPCKEVILKGEAVDLTRLPLFLHHQHDGHAYLQDTSVVSRDPDTGLINWGIYRMMYRARNETNVDMRNDSHKARIHAKAYQQRGLDMPVAVVIGGPTLDKIAAMYSVADTDDWDVLGGFYGGPAQLVKCETNDLTVPANAEIVLEGHIKTTEGWIFDEGPYGEFTGTYGGGLPRNCRLLIDCITYRKGGIYQHATIGGLHPGRTDMAVWNSTIEADIYSALKNAGIRVLDVNLPGNGSTNIAYARIRTVGGGDAKQALAIMLSCSRQWLPKIAYVFDEDVDIFDPDRVMWAFAWRLDPAKDIMILPEQNVLPLEPMCNTNQPPVNLAKVGFDCTIPRVGGFDRLSFAACHVTDPFALPQGGPTALTEEDVTRNMEAFIRGAPRSWFDILSHFSGQPYPIVYRAFGSLRHRLGRMSDERPAYPYIFADSCFVDGKGGTS